MKKMMVLICISLVLIGLVVAGGNEIQKNFVDSGKAESESTNHTEKSKNELEEAYLSLFDNYEELENSLLDKTPKTKKLTNKKIDITIKNIQNIEQSLNSESESVSKSMDTLAKKIIELAEMAKKEGLESFYKSSKSVQKNFVSISNLYFDGEFSDYINDSFSRNEIKVREKFGLD